MATQWNIVYKNRDNPLYVRLSSVDENGQTSYPDLAQSVSKIELLLGGVYYGSDRIPEAFDYATEGANGILCLRLGNIPNLPVVKDKAAEIIVYDGSHPDGIVWGAIPIKVVELTGTVYSA